MRRQYRGFISDGFITGENTASGKPGVAGAFRTDAPRGDDWTTATLTVDIPEMKKVYQWRYKNADQKHWKVAKSLLTRQEADDYFLGCSIEQHAGPFEVDV